MKLLLPLLAVVVATTTAEDATSVLDGTPQGVLRFLFGGSAEVKNFFLNTFETRVHHWTNHQANAADFIAQLNTIEPLVESLTSMDDFIERFDLWGEDIMVRTNGGEISDILTTAETVDEPFLRGLLDDGNSFVIKTELHQSHGSDLERHLATLFATTVAVHGYVTPPGAQALKPHTDPYDVLVIQTYGEKQWTICTPQPAGAQNRTDAEKAQLQEIVRHSIQGCTQYEAWQLAKMECQAITLKAGDVLYLPKGIIHYATTTESMGSTHITLSLERLTHSWLALFGRACGLGLDRATCQQYEDVLLTASLTPNGLAWLNLAAMPAVESDPTTAVCERLNYLMLGDEPTSLVNLLADDHTRKLNMYARSNKDLRALLTTILDCSAPDQVIFAMRQTHRDSIKRRETDHRPPCYYSSSCNDYSSCDCNDNCDDNCNIWGDNCDAECDGSCDCDNGVRCKNGYYVSDYWRGECTDCPSGKYGDDGYYCGDCWPGKYSSGSRSTYCTSCPAGKYTDQYTQSSCKNAGQGYYVSSSSSNSRWSCAPGKYSDEETATSCKDCSSANFPGTYQDQYGQGSCKTCPEGKYAVGDRATSCVDGVGVLVQPIMSARSMELVIENSGPPREGFRVTLGIWRNDEYAWDTAAGYPKEYDADQTGGSYDAQTRITLNYLIPGTYYYIKVEGRQNGGYPDSFEYPQAQTACACGASEVTGAPADVTTRQHRGRVFFAFSDMSYCEDGFLLYRDGSSFTSGYDVKASQACERRYAPETIYDDVATSSELQVGHTYQYCISAYSKTSFVWAEDSGLTGSYESAQTCISHQVLWEAELTGRVQLTDAAGNLAVADTNIEWFYERNGVFVLGGNLTTDADGRFAVYVKTDLLGTEQEMLVLRPSKTSGTVQHRYTCNGLPCTEQRILVKALTFDQETTFVDATTVPFEGSVFVKGTEHANYALGCPLRNARVCLYNHHAHTALGCARTSITGYYVVPVAAGLTVYPVVEYNNHTFERVNTGRAPTGRYDSVSLAGEALTYDYYAIKSDEVSQPTIFIDTSAATMTMQMAGGRCNRTLGTTTVQITYATCLATWSKDITFSTYEHVVDLPQQEFFVELMGVQHDSEILGETVPAFFEEHGGKKLTIDLKAEEPDTARWEYHPEPQITVHLSGDRSGECSFAVLEREAPTTISVTAIEPFWSTIESCSWVEGNITLVNQIGETPETVTALLRQKIINAEKAARLGRCAGTGCYVPLELASDDAGRTFHSAHVAFEAMGGEPELVMEVEGVANAKLLTAQLDTAFHSVSKLVPVVVTGDKLISELFTMVAATSMSADVKASLNGDDSVTFATTISVQTSDDLGSPSGHMFITPALTVRYIETREVLFNASACSTEVIEKVTWSLGDSGSNTNSFTIKMYADIRDAEIPTLENNLVHAEADLASAMTSGTQAEKDEAQEKVDKLKEAILGWKGILNYTDEVLYNASTGALEPLTGLMPGELFDAARDLDRKPDGKAADELEKYSAISFMGGGQLYSYEESVGVANSTNAGTMVHDEGTVGGFVENKLAIAGTGPAFEIGIGYQMSADRADVTTKEKSSESVRGFVLGDGDAGDKFVVKPRLIIQSQPTGPVAPGHSALLHIRLINDANEANQFQLYVRDIEGLDVRMNDETLLGGRFFEQMAPYSEYEEVVHVTPIEGHTSVTFKMGFRSQCEHDTFLVTGSWSPASFQASEHEITIDFMQPCSTIEWAGDVAKSGRVVINTNHADAYYPFLARNPGAPDSFWADDARLEGVNLEFRPYGSTSWTTAVSGPVTESRFGYASLDWQVENLADGRYEVRLSTQCESSGSAAEGADSHDAGTIEAVLDRAAPRVFGLFPRAGSEAVPGDNVEAVFNEPLNCEKPSTVRVTVKIGAEVTVTEQVLDVLCQGNTIHLSISNAFSSAALSGKSVQVTLSDIYDAAGNKMSQPVSWSFTYAELADAVPVPVSLDGLRFNVPWNASFGNIESTAFVDFSATLASELATVLSVSETRVELTSLREVSGGAQTVGTLKFFIPADPAGPAANDGLSAEQLASLFLTTLYIDDTPPSLVNGGILEALDLDYQPSQSLAVARRAAAGANMEADLPVASSTADSNDSEGNSADLYQILTLGVCISQFAVLAVMLVRRSRRRATEDVATAALPATLQ
ncbi:uncharacterized protein MONBRDRAFT_11172 [Monosiga brevicollis MX1]|uniref:Ribosomal oxygenase 2 n=1 Tax=Monosiga brevicollis TaxID=81824 RepID=A9V8E8_MONBE|nr:uncharacterized protein MONBRDRAFT_11172 [Monosiga brevicollis MX1]EDQ86327.1 predicted protein [Monosiga brevicollis MX1]|eukprot:XP_001748997.1 hypothetical protein [Monosiga brevicollis MX1]